MLSRKTINTRWKTVLLLAVLQTACLAVGLWVQYRFVLALADWNHQAIVVQSVAGGAKLVEVGQSASPETLREAMVMSLPYAFFWISGLQIAVVYLVLMRLHHEQREKQTRSKEASTACAKELVRTRDAVIFGLAKLARIA